MDMPMVWRRRGRSCKWGAGEFREGRGAWEMCHRLLLKSSQKNYETNIYILQMVYNTKSFFQEDSSPRVSFLGNI